MAWSKEQIEMGEHLIKQKPIGFKGLKYIPDTINFYPVTKNKYNNCPKRKDGDEDTELFAGDKIIGMYKKKEGNMCLCLYEWKEQNNPIQIEAYSLLKEIEITEEILDVKIFKPNTNFLWS